MASRPSFSPSAAWDEVSHILRGQTRLLAAIAGVFFLLPAVLVNLHGPAFGTAASLEEAFALARPYVPILLLSTLVQYVGQLAIWSLILSPDRPTVGGAIGRGLALLPLYFLLILVSNLLIVFGLLLLVLPGLYLLARLAPVGAAFVAEKGRWPFPAIARSFELTKSNALPIFAFLVIVGLIYLVVMIVASLVFGALLALLGLAMESGEIGAALLAIFSGVVNAAGTTIFTLMAIAIYRQLTDESRVEKIFS